MSYKKLTNDMIAAAYERAKRVYHGHQHTKEALDILEKTHGINRNTARDLIMGFEKMMEGKRYGRGLSINVVKYFFESILADYGTDALENALLAVESRVEYVANLPNGSNSISLRYVMDEYRNKLHRRAQR